MIALRESTLARSPECEHKSPEPSVLLQDISWDMYVALRSVGANNHMRMTYDAGALEIMSPSRKHAKISTLIAALITEWAVRHDLEVEFGGDTTFRSEDLSRGLEPDQCFWIARQAAVRGKDEIDLSVDPPPDLALEIEVSRPALAKLPIYRALGVPEVWRWREDQTEILVLTGDEYVVQAESVALAGFPLRLADEFLRQREQASDTALVRQFRKAIAQ